MDELDDFVAELEKKPTPKPESNTNTNSQGVIIKRYMTEVIVTCYPNGDEYVTSRSWCVGKKVKTSKKKVKKKTPKQVQLQSVEEY